MSEPPTGDPYGAGPPEGSPRPGWYGPPPYQAAPGQGYPPGSYPPGYRPGGQVSASTITALIVGCFSVLIGIFCCAPALGGVPAIILSAIALSRANSDPESAHTLSRWAWISLAIGYGLSILVGVGYVVYILAYAH